MKSIKQLVLTAIVLASGYSFAQDNQNSEPLITDRPDATEAPSVVQKKYIQVETGAFYESYAEQDFKIENFTYNTTLIRYGLIDNLELRLGWNLIESKSYFNFNQSNTISTLSPLLFGVKIGITEEKGALPEIGFIGHLNLPFTVKEAIRPQTTGVDFRFSFAHTLSERSSFSYNLGAAWGNDSPETNYLYTMAYGYSITEKFGMYAELYGYFPENNRAAHLWDAGVTYLLSNNVQLDATVGSSITEGQDILLSAGISFRLPN